MNNQPDENIHEIIIDNYRMIKNLFLW